LLFLSVDYDAVGHEFGGEADLFKQGRPLGRGVINLQELKSKAAFQGFAVKHAAVMKGRDEHVASLLGILSDMAMENNKPIYMLRREGIDLIQRPDTDEDILDFVWVSPTEIISLNNPTQFRYSGSPNVLGLFRSDLMKAPVLGTTALA
jgi:hypothetical protein